MKRIQLANAIRLWIKLAGNELAHNVFGRSEARYHSVAATLLEDLGKYEHCIDHCRKYLSIASDDFIREMLAFCYLQTGDSVNAVIVYRSLGNIWSDPQVTLNLALAEMNSGNIAKAKALVDFVDVTNNNKTGLIEPLIRQLYREMGVSPKESKGGTDLARTVSISDNM